MSRHTIRRWVFLATTFDDERFFLGGGGEPIDETQTVPFVGTQNEAITEGDRRVDLWEDTSDGLVAEIASQSQGVVSEGETR